MRLPPQPSIERMTAYGLAPGPSSAAVGPSAPPAVWVLAPALARSPRQLQRRPSLGLPGRPESALSSLLHPLRTPSPVARRLKSTAGKPAS